MSSINCYRTTIEKSSPTKLDFNLSEINLFYFNPKKYIPQIEILKEHLDNSELKRANNYHFKKDTHQFIVCRAILKMLLSKYSGINTNSIEIKYNDYKKPYSDQFDFYFNISHSENCALIGISSYKLGVDIESVKTNYQFDDVLNFTFNEDEIEYVSISRNKVASFFELWTRKEALLKAIGKGLDETLINLSVLDGKNAANKIVFDDYNIFSFNINEFEQAALAIENSDFRGGCLKIYQLPQSFHGLLKLFEP
ncbi:MAG: 4'-phosphopantetheinyl transferase family protein [bacterium]